MSYPSPYLTNPQGTTCPSACPPIQAMPLYPLISLATGTTGPQGFPGTATETGATGAVAEWVVDLMCPV